MVRIDASINVGDDPAAADPETLLCIGDAHDLRWRLVNVAIPDLGTVIGNWSILREFDRDVFDYSQAASDSKHLIEFGIDNSHNEP